MNSIGPLLSQLEETELPTVHLQHLRVRLSRQFAELIVSPNPTTQHEQHIRIRSRLDEIEEELREAAAVQQEEKGTLTEQARSYLSLAGQVKATREQLEQLGRQIEPRLTPGGSAPPSRDISSSPEPRIRKTRPPPSTAATTASDLEAFLQSNPAPLAAPSYTHAKSLSDAFTLHLLATSPASVLLPGTSLASVFRSQLHQDPSSATLSPRKANSSTTAPAPSLEDRVAASVRAAYFVQAVEDISNGAFDNAAAGRAWTKLRQDLWDAARPLVPSRLGGGTVKRELELALTGEEVSFDILTATTTLHKLVELMGKLCAPARDPQVQASLSSLSPSTASIQSLVDVVRQTLELAEGMQADLQGFRKNLAGATMDDSELEDLARKLAMERERKVVGEVLIEGVTAGTEKWVKTKLGERGAGWSAADRRERGALVKLATWEALFGDEAVAVPSFDQPPPDLPSQPANTLPPILFVPAPRLFALQNTLQALVILGCLQHLAPPSSPTFPLSTADDLTSRLWTLLTSTSSSTTAPEDWSHLPHLSDEIASAWDRYRSKSSSTTAGAPLDPPVDAEAERTRIRTAVDRIVRYEDPVYRLLKGRLKEGLIGSSMMTSPEEAAPSEMRSGRQLPKSSTSTPSRASARTVKSQEKVVTPTVKGFERPELREKVEAAAREGWDVLNWVGEVWGEGVGCVL